MPRNSDALGDHRLRNPVDDAGFARPERLVVSPIFRETLRRLRAAPLAMLGSWLLLRLLAAAVVAPLASAGTNWMIARTGRYAVANEDILRFALSPVGAAMLVVAGGVTVISLALSRTAVLLVARERTEHSAAAKAIGQRRRVASIARAVLGAVRRLPTISRLVARQFAALALVVAPLAALVLLIAWLVTREVDLYWLVTIRPTRFWVGSALLAPVVLLLAWLVALRLLRWSIALPLCVLEGRRPASALHESADLLRGELLRVAAARLAWFAAVSLAGAALLAAVHLASKAALSRELGSLSLTAMAAGVALAAHGTVLAVEGLVAGIGDTLVLYALWRRRSPTAASAVATPRDPAGDVSPSRRASLRWTVPAAILAAVLAGAVASASILASINRPIVVELTAHRGASRAAPENTLAAIREAIRLGADRIELDVMLTGDGELVLFHDVDLRRIANDPRRIADLTLAEIQQFDVGSWFDPAFATERAPSLAEALVAAGWGEGSAQEADATPRMAGFPLNIELKTQGDDDVLATKVAAALKAHGDDRSIVTSLSMRALEAYRRVDPERRIGAIVTASLGDLRRLDVDLYAVNAGLATAALIGNVHEIDREVHAWTVTDPDLLTRLALRGVDGVITSDVEPIRHRLGELAQLDDLERLLLAFRARLLE